MFLVSGVDAEVLGEIQPAHDADLLSHVTMHLSHFRIARRLDQRAVESLVQLGHPPAIQQAPLRRACQMSRRASSRSSPSARSRRQAFHRRQFQHDAQIVQRLEALEVEGPRLPAAARLASTKPSRSSRARPNRTGVRLTPSRAARSVSVKRSPGSSRKLNRSSFIS